MDIKLRYRLRQSVICRPDGMGFEHGDIRRAVIRILEDGTQVETYTVHNVFQWIGDGKSKPVAYDRELSHTSDDLDLFFKLYKQCAKKVKSELKPEDPELTTQQMEERVLWDMRPAYDKYKETLENANKNPRPWENTSGNDNTDGGAKA